MIADKDPVLWLRSHYQVRKSRNEAYSLRAFSRDLEVPSGRLSEFLSRKRMITAKTLWRFVNRLETAPQQAQEIFTDMAATYSKPSALADVENYTLKNDDFELIAAWYHYGILSLMNTIDFRSDPKWIGRRLGIDAVTARDALERLKRLNLIRDQGGKLRRTHEKVTTSQDVTSEALRLGHRQSIGKAVASLDEFDVNLREITSITMAIDPGKLPRAKRAMRKFKRDLAKILECGKRSEVYELNVLLTPLTKIR